MLVKEENKQTIILSEAILFDDQLIRKITFDLMHINHGWDAINYDYAYRNRSNYTARDIIRIISMFKYAEADWRLGENKFNKIVKGINYYRYLWQTTDHDNEVIRVYMDIPHQYTSEGVIVTIFKPL